MTENEPTTEGTSEADLTSVETAEQEAQADVVTEDTEATPDEAGGLVPNSVREEIAGEPGPAREDLRAKALDPAEASVDVRDDPLAAGVPMDYVEGEAVSAEQQAEEADTEEDPSADTEDEQPGFPETEPDATPEHQDDEA